MKIVIDTNVIVSALFFGGKPRALLELVATGHLDIFVTQEILAEYYATINYQLEEYHGHQLSPFLPEFTKVASVIEPSSRVRVCRDPDDNKFIECALDGQCSYIVSGDKDLLDIRHYKNIRIITVLEFLGLYGT